MKKMTKLLSVLLAMVMILSTMSVMASAAVIRYETTTDLTGMAAYGPDGEVTRLTTEERMSIVADTLDDLLESLNINMGEINLYVAKININLTSINNLLATLDSFHGIKTLLGIAGIADLGILEEIELGAWDDYTDMSRENNTYNEILTALLTFLDAQDNLINAVFTNGLDLGIIAGFIGNLDLSGINKIVTDLPSMIKGMIVPLFQRWDDSVSLINTYETAKTGSGGFVTVLNGFVQRLFTNNMSITTVKANASGTITSAHKLPTTNSTRCYYEISNGQLKVYNYVTASAASSDPDLVGKEGTWVCKEDSDVYTLTEELDGAGKATGDYVFSKMDAVTGAVTNFKYYEDNSPLLPEFKTALENGTVSIDLTTQSAVNLLHTFIPYVFDAMVPVVVNGSLKKLLGGLFGAEYTYVGEVGSDEVAALADGTNVFFTQEQGDYLWEWSDYAVINGTHYYRFEDQIFVGDIAGANPFFDNIDWDWNFGEGYFNKYLPANSGYQTILQSLNNFLVDVALEVFDDTFEATIGLTKGDNSNLVENLKKGAQTFIAVSPESLFGSDYADADRYYSLIMSDDNQEVLVGIACTIIDLVMPQALLPKADAIKGTGLELGAILAFVLRELATQLVPQYNYDALIYSNYNTKAFVAGKDNAYWLDVILTIGTDIGLYYLSALADMGEDDAAWSSGAYYYTEKTYAEADLTATGTIKLWEARVDYIVDWGLTSAKEYAWNFEKIVKCSNVDLATAQDPWAKIGEVFLSFIPVAGIFNVDTSDAQWLKTLLKDNFVLAILDLDITKIVGGTEANGIINIPTTSKLYSANVLTQVVTVIRNLLNNLLSKVTNGAELLSSSTFTTIDDVLNQTNIKSLVINLLTLLPVAHSNGLLTPIVPILNFFMGWQTNPQKFSDPTMTLADTANGGAYLLSASGAIDGTFTVKNTSTGMLFKHNPEGTFDSAYVVTVKSITTDADLTAYASDGTTAFAATSIQPNSEASFRLKGTYTADTAFRIDVTYTVTGKSGAAIGDELVKSFYAYMDDSVVENTQIASHTDGYQVKASFFGNKKDAVRVQREAFDRIIYAPSLQAGVVARTLTYTNNSESDYSEWVYSATGSGNPAFVTVNQDYVHGCNENSVLKESKIGWMSTADGGTSTNVLAPLNYVASFDDSAYVSGTISPSLGTVNTVWHNHKSGGNTGVGNDGDVKVTIQSGDLGVIYVVDTSSVVNAVNDYNNKNVHRSDYVDGTEADAAFAAYETAMKAAVRTAYLPYMSDATTFAAEFGVDTLEALVETLDEAYAALDKHTHANAASAGAADDDKAKVLKDALAAAETGEADINFQDYDLYEYFNYQDYRTGTRNRIAQYNVPTAPVNALYTVDGYGITDKAWDEDGNEYAELTNKVYGSASGKTLQALKAATSVPTEADNDAYAAALEAYVAPSYSDLDNADQAQKLGYYKTFLKERGTEAKAMAFLSQEIAYATAQNYVEADYSVDSWAAYADALATANAMTTANLQSEIFSAKYELMKAQKNLLLASKSVKDNAETYLADLEALMTMANNILNTEYYGAKAGYTEDEALAALIKALGYKYTNQFGDEVVLFDNCAIEYMTWDRENTKSNLSRIDACEAALQAAIDMFECTIKVVEKNGDETTTVEQDFRIINGIEPGSIKTMAELLAHVEATNAAATLAPTASKANAFGTGAKVDVNVAELGTLTTYYVVIYGDVNGDGAVDAFDAIEVDTDVALEGAYATAADTNGDGVIDAADYSAIASASATTSVIAQVKA